VGGVSNNFLFFVPDACVNKVSSMEQKIILSKKIIFQNFETPPLVILPLGDGEFLKQLPLFCSSWFLFLWN